MTIKKYYDMVGEQIMPGDILEHKNGDREEVYLSGDGDLGFNAMNANFLKYHPDADIYMYPLSNFNLREWKIVQEEE